MPKEFNSLLTSRQLDHGGRAAVASVWVIDLKLLGEGQLSMQKSAEHIPIEAQSLLHDKTHIAATGLETIGT